MIDLPTFWFLVLGALLTGYAILDGFDLGVGALHLFARGDEERRVLLNAIGPLWDGNEVWLVTFGGALFAAFPKAYAAAFSGFYLPFMILLFALIFRAVSIEFRSKRAERGWRTFWDLSFSAASVAAAFLFGVAVGNSMQGLPLGPDGEFVRSLPALLRPYPILVGALTVATFAMHGAIYLGLKTEGELHRRVHGWMWRSFGVFLTLFMLTTVFTLVTLPHATLNFQHAPIGWVVVVLNILAIANIPRAIHSGRGLYAFVSSACVIAALTFLFGVALYPNLLVSSLDPAFDLTIHSASSSAKTLGIMRIVLLLGMPFVAAYTSVVYWVFRGKVKMGTFSY